MAKSSSKSRTRDRTNRFAVDSLIRKHGFEIFSRPKGIPALWIREGRIYPQTEVERMIDPNDLGDAEYFDAMEKAGTG